MKAKEKYSNKKGTLKRAFTVLGEEVPAGTEVLVMVSAKDMGRSLVRLPSGRTLAIDSADMDVEQ